MNLPQNWQQLDTSTLKEYQDLLQTQAKDKNNEIKKILNYINATELNARTSNKDKTIASLQYTVNFLTKKLEERQQLIRDVEEEIKRKSECDSNYQLANVNDV